MEGEGDIRGVGGGVRGLTGEEVRPRGGYEHSCIYPPLQWHLEGKGERGGHWSLKFTSNSEHLRFLGILNAFNHVIMGQRTRKLVLFHMT